MAKKKARAPNMKMKKKSRHHKKATKKNGIEEVLML